MGLHINIAVTLREIFTKLVAGGRVLTLGVQDVSFSRQAFNLVTDGVLSRGESDTPTATEFFKACGFSHLETLDVSDFEGAEHIVDLNQPELPQQLIGKFDCVLNGGTLEHVFHLPNALTSITRMLVPGGLAVHVFPVHNWVDHGLYQINPILFHCYYSAAGFDILESLGFLFSVAVDDQSPWEVFPCPIGTFAEGLCGTLDARAMLGVFVARKTEESLDHPTPVQPMYAVSGSFQTHAARVTPAWFPRYGLLNGRRVKECLAIEIELGPFVHKGGYCWVSNLPPDVPVGDGIGQPVRSPLVLFEDDTLQTPAHSAHTHITSVGRGAYSHWQGELYLSTSDNSDPNSNGRKYRVVFPKATFAGRGLS